MEKSSKSNRADDTYCLLLNKDILSILDGDTPSYSPSLTEEVKMPYLSGSEIVKIMNRFGIPVRYETGMPSRWMLMERLLEHCIEQGSISDLLATLFCSPLFATQEACKNMSRDEVEKYRTAIVDSSIESINRMLMFGGNELALLAGRYVVKPYKSTAEVASPKIQHVTAEMIKDYSLRAHSDIDRGEYDSAITKARTILEETFIYLIESKGEAPSTNGDIGELFKQSKSLYGMTPNADGDKRVNDLINGLNKVVNAIGSMRNIGGDAHGLGENRLRVSDYHARLLVNSAITIAEFMLSVKDNSRKS